MNPLPVLAVAILTGFAILAIYIFRDELRSKYIRRALTAITFGILVLVAYLSTAPYFILEPTGEKAVYATNITKTLTNTSNTSSTTVTTISATMTSPIYRASAVASSYFMLVYAVTILSILIGFYYIIREMITYR